jgi:steroid delta-isomerase-like uncharacterized protein
MSTNDNENLLRQLIEVENSHDIDRLVSLLADDVVIEDIPLGAVMKGKDGVKQGYVSFLKVTPDFKIELKSWITTDKSFALEAIFTGTQKGDLPGLSATGKSFSNRVCSFGEFEDGKMKGRRDYWDSASMVKQLVGESK